MLRLESNPQQRVEEPKGAPPARDELIIEERDNARKDWAAAARPTNCDGLAIDNYNDILPHRGDVRESPASGVIEPRIRVSEVR